MAKARSRAAALCIAASVAGSLGYGRASAQLMGNHMPSPAGHSGLVFGGVVIWEDDAPARDPNDPTQMTEAEFQAYLQKRAAQLPPRSPTGDAAQDAAAAAALAAGAQQEAAAATAAAVAAALQQLSTQSGAANAPQDLVEDYGAPQGDDDMADFAANLQDSLADTAIEGPQSAQLAATGPQSAQLAAIYANYDIVLGQNGSTVMLVPSSQVAAPSDVMNSLDLQPALCGR